MNTNDIFGFSQFLLTSNFFPHHFPLSRQAQGKVPTVLRSRFWFAFATGTRESGGIGAIKNEGFNQQKWWLNMLQPTTIVIKPAKMVMWLAKMVTEAANINGVFHQQNMVFFTQQNGLLNLAGWNHEGLGLWWKMGYQWMGYDGFHSHGGIPKMDGLFHGKSQKNDVKWMICGNPIF